MSEQQRQQQASQGGAIVEHSQSAGDELIGQLSESEPTLVVEEKKPVNRSTIVMFAVLVVGAAGVWFMYQRAGGPRATAAANKKEAVAAKETINSFLSGGDSNIKVMETMLRNTQKVVQQFLSYPSMTQVPLSDLRTNPFRLKPDNARPADPGATSEAAERRRREEERLAALKAVQGLHLQSIMYGGRKACMINNALYVENQQVENFIVEKINQTSVVVKNGSYRFELRMQK